MQNQAYAFLIFILNGLIVGILFDVFRILRKAFKTSDFITYIQDIIFWISSGLILLYSIFKFNNGELRLFILLGIILGMSIHLLVFSKILITVTVYIINITKKAFNFLIIIPIKYLFKIMNKLIIKPVIFLYKKAYKLMKKIMSFFINKFKKLFFNNRIYKSKKDFVWICRILI